MKNEGQKNRLRVHGVVVMVVMVVVVVGGGADGPVHRN